MSTRKRRHRWNCPRGCDPEEPVQGRLPSSVRERTTTDPDGLNVHVWLGHEPVTQLRESATDLVHALPEGDGAESMIGSEPSSPLRIVDPSGRVSRKHARLVREGLWWRIEDLQTARCQATQARADPGRFSRASRSYETAKVRDMGGPPKKKRHHYVPQFVLRNFSPDGGGAVPTLVLESGEFHERSSVRGQCARDYFYGRDTEDAFAQSEAKVSAVLRRAAAADLVGFDALYRLREFPDTAEYAVLQEHPLHVLRQFIYYQAHRTAASADEMEENIDRSAKRWLQKDPRFRETAPEAFEHLDDVIIKLDDTMGHILYSAAPFSFGMLDMTVKLLVVDEPSFILSDHPVVRRNQFAEVTPGGPGALGTLARGLQMFMPVSPTVTLAI